MIKAHVITSDCQYSACCDVVYCVAILVAFYLQLIKQVLQLITNIGDKFLHQKQAMKLVGLFNTSPLSYYCGTQITFAHKK